MLTSKTQLFPRRTEGVVNCVSTACGVTTMADGPHASGPSSERRKLCGHVWNDFVSYLDTKVRRDTWSFNNPEVREITALIKRVHSVDNKNKTIHRIITAKLMT